MRVKVHILFATVFLLMASQSWPLASSGSGSPGGAETFHSDSRQPNLRSTVHRKDMQDTDYLPGRIVFRIKDELASYAKANGIDHAFFNKTLASMNGSSIRKVFPSHQSPSEKFHPSGEELTDLSLIYEIELESGQSPDEAIRILTNSGLVVYAEQKYLPELLYVQDDEPDKLFAPDDSLLFTQYYLNNIQAYAAWAVARGDSNTVIGIIDTGNDFNHQDLKHSVKYNHDDPINGEDSDQDGYVDNFFGWNLGQGNNNPQYDAHGHGVHVSGTASATANNGLGIAGTGYYSRYLPVKVDDEFGRLVKAYEGIVYAADQGVSVMNCSWGGPLRGGNFGNDIVRYATFNKDVLIVAGAGNEGNNLPFYPASYDVVFGVAATDSLDKKWALSSYGSHIGIAAPGVHLLSTWPDNQYIKSSGTSMSAPIVAGAAAIVRSHFPELSALQVAARLQATADPIDTISGNESYAGQLGPGRLNMYRALTDDFTPYIRVAENSLISDPTVDLSPGKTIPMEMRFQNMLAPAENMSATISTPSPFVSISDSILWLGPMQTLETTDTGQHTYYFTIDPAIPPNHLVNFEIHFIDGDNTPAGKYNFGIAMNRDYLTISSGRLQTTITSKGNIGYNYPDYSQGAGFVYNRDVTRIKCAGFLYGNDTERVLDNIYGVEEDTFSEHFTTVSTVHRADQPAVADIEVAGSFGDEAVDSLSFGIETSHHSYFWEDENMDRFFIQEYQMINQTEQNYAGMYAGFYVDWTSHDNKRMLATFDKDHAMAYTFLATQDDADDPSSEQEGFTGLQILTDKAINHYAFDNDGTNESIRINKGFDTSEKFSAMTSSRDKAGSYRAANDVSSMLTAGPFDLASGDSTKIAFAFHIADDYTKLKESAMMAFDAYNKLILGNGTINVNHPESKSLELLAAYPNPFNSDLHIRIGYPAETSGWVDKAEIKLLIYDMLGRPVYQKIFLQQPGRSVEYTIDTRHLKPGYYMMSIPSKAGPVYKKLLKYQ